MKSHRHPAIKAPMPAKKNKARPQTASAPPPAQRRLWLMYDQKLITTPVIWQLGRKFPVITNVRQASVTDEIGIVCLELTGPRPDLNAAILWLEHLGIKVEPVEIGVIES